MNTMRLVFAIAVALALHGTANAANLRRVATEIKATVADATLVDTLADKYDCRQAGATLAETLQNVANKNGQQLEALGKECKERTVSITTPWTSAQETYATEFPKVEKEEVEQFSTAKKAANETFQTLKKNRTDAVVIQQSEYTGKKELLVTAVAAHAKAKGAWEHVKKLKQHSEKIFNDETGTKLNAATFEAAKQSANTTMNKLITIATNLQATADGLCTDIKNEREKLIIADEDLLNKDIGPLIKTLSVLKCVDSYEATKAAAGAGNGVSFVQVDANVAAQCAMLSKKITALLGLSEQRSSTTATDAPIMAQLATFTARVSEEKTHMEKLYKECMAAASTIFHDEKNNATEDKKTEVDKAKAIQTAADAQLVTDLASLVKDNDGLVATKATEMEAPLATKTAAEAEANTALASLDTAKDAVTIDIPLAKKVQNAIVLAAENVKNGNIKRRHSGLDGTKQAANATFEEEKKFLDEYCESTEADLTKELVLVNQIFCKLGGLKVTDTAATGAKAEENEKGITALLGLSGFLTPRVGGGAMGYTFSNAKAFNANLRTSAPTTTTQNKEQATPTVLVCPAPVATPAAAPVAAPAATPVATPAATPVATPIDCKVSEWSAFGDCSKPCGGGTKTRRRTVVTTPAEHSGAACPVLTDTHPCNEQACHVYDPVPNGDGSHSVPGTGLRKVVSDWTAGGTLKDNVVAKYGEIENWGTSEVTDLKYVFYNNAKFNADISKWDVSSVTNMGGTFYKATVFNADISQWDVSSVTNLQYTFQYAFSFNADISKWDVSSVIKMDQTFYAQAAFNGDLSKWNVSSVTSLSNFFYGAVKFNTDISKWDVSSVTNIAGTFEGASSFNQDISNWVVSSVTNLANTFIDASSFNADLSKWDVSSVTTMGSTFQKASSFNADISKWDVSRVTNMKHAFEHASSFDADISKWDVSSVKNMGHTFEDAKAFKDSDISKWVVSKVKDKRSIFTGCPINKLRKPSKFQRL